MAKGILLLVFIAFSIQFNQEPDPCFNGLSSIEQEPVRVDTTIVFDPETFVESCYLKNYYANPSLTPDSVLTLNDTTVHLLRTDKCYKLLSVKWLVLPCTFN